MTSDPTTIISVRIKDEHLKILEEIAEEQYRSRANVINLFVRDGIKNWKDNNENS